MNTLDCYESLVGELAALAPYVADRLDEMGRPMGTRPVLALLAWARLSKEEA